ncbi:MAG: energy-coupling factor ABC transporter ATP-binding protein [Myxococcota bacterium]|jgi:cobalt/nickel transport system ATP-binding protein|nr:energy-coupling factor ABC transporter ATP-binding protein [Myxococcota bacterium]
MSHHIVEARELAFAYPDGTAALRGVSFTIHHGEAVALVGANGAGKSTLLMHLCGHHLPSAGSVNIGGLSLSRGTLVAIRRAVGVVFGDPDDQLFMPTILEDVAFGPLNLGLSPEEARNRALEALSTVGLATLGDKPPYHLSAGEKRRAAIASVLAMNPDILLMDEPTANLDPRGRRSLIGLLKSFEHTKIIATHDLDMALEVCPRTIVMDGGAVLRDGATLEVLTDDALLEQAGLERPLRLQGCPVCGQARMHGKPHG